MHRLLASAAALACLAAPFAAQARIPSPETIVKAWDKNHDGGVDLSEWTAAGRKPERFALVDTNKDGKVSADELKIAMQRMKAAQGQ